MTGVAVHFDRPGAQSPQAVLFAMPPDEGDWTVNHVESVLLETLELARVRAVGPETLASLGHTVLSVFLADGAAVSIVPDVLSGDADLPGPIDIDLDDIIDEPGDVVGQVGGVSRRAGRDDSRRK